MADLTPAERQQLNTAACPRHGDHAPGVSVCHPCKVAGDAAVEAIIEAREAPLRTLLARFVEPEKYPCVFDHNGDCQEHGDFGLVYEQRQCSVRVARDLLGLDDTDG